MRRRINEYGDLIRQIARQAELVLRDPNFRNWKYRLIGLKDRYRGQRCFIMGNGPSLNRTPLEKLETDHVWAVNRCYLLYDRIHWRPGFYVAVDTRVIPDNAAEIQEQISAYPQTRFFFPTRVRIANFLPSLHNVYWYKEKLLKEDSDRPESFFSQQADKYVYSVYTVTIAALQLAAYLGFNPIYLIGCDTDYTVPGSVVYEDTGRNLIVGQQDDDSNHFSPQYFGKGKKYHQPYPERMVNHYRFAKAACDQLGIRVLNATIGGRLEVFPRVDFNTLF